MKFKIPFLFALFLAIMACRLISPQAKAGEPAIFETEAFSFSVPEGWLWGGSVEEYFGSDAQSIVGIRNPGGLLPSATLTVVGIPRADETSLESRFTQTYTGNTFSEMALRQEYIRGNLSGYEIYYTHPTGEGLWEYRDIWLEKGSFIYVLSFRACCNEYENYAATFEQILASFQFKP